MVVVVLDPVGDHLQHGRGIWSRLYPGVVAFESLDEGFADLVAFGTAHRREAGDEANCGSELQRFAGGVGGAIVGQPLDRMDRLGGGEPSFDAGQHQVTHHLAADPAGRSVPGDDLPVTGVDREGDADHLAVPATGLQYIGGPALIGRQGNDAALVCSHGTQADMRLQQQVCLAHEAKDPLVVDGFST